MTASTASYSIKAVATASRNVSFGQPHRFFLGTALWDGTSTSLRVYFAQRSGQTRAKDNEFYIEAFFPDSGGNAQGVYVTSRADNQGVLSAGTTLTTDSGSAWTGLTSEVMSYIDLTPTGEAKGPVFLWGVLAKDNSSANEEYWIDPKVELVA
jgi:hypothetical protein